jgi:hypothetical protein
MQGRKRRLFSVADVIDSPRFPESLRGDPPCVARFAKILQISSAGNCANCLRNSQFCPLEGAR